MNEWTRPIDLVSDTEFYLGTLSPGQASAIHRSALRDLPRLAAADECCLVIGSYDPGKFERVEFVRDTIRARSPKREAFLLEGVDPDVAAWENFYVKFRVFLRRVDYVVGVFEDNDGGHELELGEARLSETYLLKRQYLDESGAVDEGVERERYDAMLATLFDLLDRRGRLFRWTSGEDLTAAVEGLLEATTGGK